MKTTDNDILKTAPALKETPFSVPEGYFDSLRANLRKPRPKTLSLWGRLAPYATVAAVFIFLVSAGTFLLEMTTPEQEMTPEDYYMLSDNMFITTLYEMDEETQIADAGIADDDIVEYLIFSGISAEEVELSK